MRPQRRTYSKSFKAQVIQECSEPGASIAILRPSLTGILTRMERDGLVLRLKPVNDQRKLYVSLTPAGTALYESAQAEVEETYRLLEAQFTTEKLQQLTSLLEEFIALGVPAGRGDEEE